MPDLSAEIELVDSHGNAWSDEERIIAGILLELHEDTRAVCDNGSVSEAEQGLAVGSSDMSPTPSFDSPAAAYRVMAGSPEHTAVGAIEAQPGKATKRKRQTSGATEGTDLVVLEGTDLGEDDVIEVVMVSPKKKKARKASEASGEGSFRESQGKAKDSEWLPEDVTSIEQGR